MASDITVRAGLLSAPVAATRPVAEAVQHAVPTELPEPQSVTAARHPAELGNDPEFNRDRHARQIVYDRKAGQYVYQVLDQTDDSVIIQYPDESRMRARAYFRAMDMLKHEQLRDPVADKKA